MSQLPQRKDHGHFNPRSREGSDRLDLGYMLRRLISIHAPAKGATCGAEVAVLLVRISIHAPAKGATRAERTYHGTHHNFNPRSREGSDQAQRRRREPAPFQSTLPRRERRLPHRSLYRMLRFQSTLPRRERPMMSDLFRQVTAHFNPRSREGSDYTVHIIT